MFAPRRAAVLLIALITANATGCIAFYSYHTVEVSVRDAETDEPIGGANVELSYAYMLVLNAPKGEDSVTDAHGQSQIRAATFDLRQWSASANGYIPGKSAEHGDLSEPIQFRLYRVPSPTIMVIVPNGYRGLLKLDFRPAVGRIQGHVGDRRFIFHATTEGYVRIEATPLLLKIEPYSNEIRVEYENGDRIVEPDSFSELTHVRLRWMDEDFSDQGIGKHILYVVGTDADQQAIRPKIYDYINGDPMNISLNHDAFDKLFDEPPTTKP